MECPNCKTGMKEVTVGVEDAKQKVTAYQCPKCEHFEFEEVSARKVIDELREKYETPLKIKQKVIKLSRDRLGMYFNKDVVRSLNLRAGEEVYVSVPDKKHIVMELG